MAAKIKKTAKQAALSEAINKTDTSWETITEESMVDLKLSEDPYRLPMEAQEKLDNKEFVFRWIEDSVARVDEITRLDAPMRWWICNSTNTPFLEKYVDSCDGGVHCKDQLLVFKPYWMHQKIKNLKSNISEAKMSGGLLKNKVTDSAEFLTGEEHRITGSDIIMVESE